MVGEMPQHSRTGGVDTVGSYLVTDDTGIEEVLH